MIPVWIATLMTRETRFVVLPGMTSFEASRRAYTNVDVIIISARRTQRRNTCESGASLISLKPYN
jgi:hypothetical protein